MCDTREQHEKPWVRRTIGGLFLVAVAAVFVACGGGSDNKNQTAQDARQQPLAVGSAPTITWTPTGTVAFEANPGSKVAFPITFTTPTVMGNISVNVTPELRGLVTATVSKSVLQPGQSATVTLTFNVSASESLRVVDGAVQVIAGRTTASMPLSVRLSLVAPETINGIPVAPQPPTVLNNITLAGFDLNVNGVRDDVERAIATTFGASAAKHSHAVTFSTAEQHMLVRGTPEALAWPKNGLI